jgi:hypothetical protein
MADKRIPNNKARSSGKARSTKPKPAQKNGDDKPDNQPDGHGGMNLSNFKKNLGCG